MGKPLALPLGIDFASIDRDLNMVADKIEAVGKNVKIGVNMSGSGGSIGADLGGFGDRLATGIAGGIRSSSAVMLAFAARFEGMFDRVGGAAITIFKRIDAAIKFPAWDAFFRGASAKLMNFAAVWKKPLTNMDLAATGAFGAIIAKVTKVVISFAETIAASISRGFNAAIDRVVVQFEKMNQTIYTSTTEVITAIADSLGKVGAGIRANEADAKVFLATQEKTAATVQRFNMGTAGMASMFPGPKIGAGTDFTAGGGGTTRAATDMEKLAVHAAIAEKAVDNTAQSIAKATMYGHELAAVEGNAADLFRGMAIGARLLIAPLAAAAGAAMGTVGAILRIGNFMSSIGPVTKKRLGDMFNKMVAISTLGFVSNATESIGRFNNSIVASNSLLGKMIGTVTGLGGAILAAFGAVGIIYKAVQFIGHGVSNAKDLATAVERGKSVFGESFGVVNDQAELMQKNFKVVKQDTLDIADGFGAMAQGAGASAAESAAFANRMTKMAADIVAAGEAGSMREAGDALMSGLSGRGMELKRLGAVMDEDAVKAYSLAKGVRKEGEEMDRMTTFATRAALIERGLTTTHGALERNTGTAADQFRRAGGGMEAFATNIGTLLMPAILNLTGAFNTLMSSVLTFVETNKASITAWADTIKQKVEFVGVIVRNLDIVWEMTQLQFGMHVENIIRHAQTIPGNFGLIFDWLRRNWLNMLTDLRQMQLSFIKNIFTNWMELGRAIGEFMVSGKWEFNFTPLLEGFKATTESLPEMIKPALVNVDGQMKELGDKMAKREADRLAGMQAAGAAPAKPGALPELEKDKKGADYKLSSAVEVNSKEAASIIARSQTAGIGKGDKASEHLKVAKTSDQHLADINNKLGAGAVKLAIK